MKPINSLLANLAFVRKQLRETDRYFDLKNQRLPLREWQDLNYMLMRYRRASQQYDVRDLVWWTSSEFRPLFALEFLDYARSMWGSSVNVDLLPEVFVPGKDSYSFQFPAGVRIHLMSSAKFDALLGQPEFTPNTLISLEQTAFSGFDPLEEVLTTWNPFPILTPPACAWIQNFKMEKPELNPSCAVAVGAPTVPHVLQKA